MDRTTFFVLCAVIATFFVIYLSPLKHLNLIDPNPQEMDPTEFWEKYQQDPERYIFLDVRDQRSHEISHAKGSKSQPIASLFDLRRDFPKTGKEIVLICTTGRLAGVAYSFLEHWGHLNLLRLEGGMHNWVAQGLPIEGVDITAPLPERD